MRRSKPYVDAGNPAIEEPPKFQEGPVNEPVNHMDCPKCGCNDVSVTHTRRQSRLIRRRRKCNNRDCNHAFWTNERTPVEETKKKQEAQTK